MTCYTLPDMPELLQNNSLADQLSRLLTKQITSGQRVPGSRLPTEGQFAAEFGVSRSVVREAVARLKAEGLVQTRQGVGARVADPLVPGSFKLPEATATRDGVVGVFELRLAVESEAAAMAAARATVRQRAAITEALERAEASTEAGADGVAEDLAFHRAIVRGANNAYFDEFVLFLARYTLQQASLTRGNSRAARLLDQLGPEHRAIHAAIIARNPGAAREAVRTHFTNGIRRLSGRPPRPD